MIESKKIQEQTLNHPLPPQHTHQTSILPFSNKLLADKLNEYYKVKNSTFERNIENNTYNFFQVVSRPMCIFHDSAQYKETVNQQSKSKGKNKKGSSFKSGVKK